MLWSEAGVYDGVPARPFPDTYFTSRSENG
jgi:hypothetical protein